MSLRVRLPSAIVRVPFDPLAVKAVALDQTLQVDITLISRRPPVPPAGAV